MAEIHCTRSDTIIIHDTTNPNFTLTVGAEVLWPKLVSPVDVESLEEQVNDLKIELERRESELADLRAERG